MSKRALILIFAIAAAGAIAIPPLAAQSNEVLDNVLAQASLSYANAAYLVGTSAGRVPETATPEEAVPQVEQAGWGLPGRGAGDAVTLGDFSFMLTRAFDIHGSLMSWIVPGPRYATRELAYLDIISGPAKPGMSLSGDRALRMLERVLNRREAAQ